MTFKCGTRFIFLRAKKYKMDVYGIRNGTLGLIKRPLDVEKLVIKHLKDFLLNREARFWEQIVKETLLSFTTMERLLMFLVIFH